MDSVLEAQEERRPNKIQPSFNPSFCGFGIGGSVGETSPESPEMFQS